jgi:N-acetylglucosaminyldiphosphoundecaprenol N-acetyl-beta-D-mannosaminyltransferase
MPGYAPVYVLGVQVHPYPTVDALHDDLYEIIKNNPHKLVLNVNAHALNLAYEQEWLRSLLNRAEIVFCDGKGVMLGASLLGGYIPINIGYGRWIWKLSEFLVEHDLSIYLVGGRPGVADKAAEKLQETYPKLRIVGMHHGYFDKSAGSRENLCVIDDINRVQPDVLLVCFGMPFQEEWLMRNWDSLQVKVALTGGAALDYTAAIVPRAPLWVSAIGMEWCWRLVIEPRRLWRRYILGNPKFLYRIACERLAKRTGSVLNSRG